MGSSSSPTLRSIRKYSTDTPPYSAPDAIDAAFESLDAIADDVLAFAMPEIRAARALIGLVDGLSARDALHVAVMQKAGINRILSFDGGFDACPGIDRLT